jgi:hypothetical protein
MRYKVFGLVVMALVMVLSGGAYGHHSFAATYIVDQTATIEGSVSEFLYRNPHSFLKVEAKDDKGETHMWAIEWGGAAQLGQDHVTKDVLKVGDHVICTGNPARDPTEHRMRMNSISRPSDGWKWQGRVQ